jgi:hypothetical protein
LVNQNIFLRRTELLFGGLGCLASFFGGRDDAAPAPGSLRAGWLKPPITWRNLHLQTAYQNNRRLEL